MIIKIFRGILQVIFRKCHISLIYKNKYGIKSLNQLMKSIHYEPKDALDLNEYDKVYLGFDALIDKYTLCDVSVTDSPHYRLMLAIDSGQDIKETDYYYRCKCGCIDTRYSLRMTNSYLNKMHETFKLRKKEIIEGKYRPIQIYCINDKYYIADGKHRAALCALLHVPMRCELISSDFLKDSFRSWIIEEMKRNSELFSKHVELLEFRRDEDYILPK